MPRIRKISMSEQSRRQQIEDRRRHDELFDIEVGPSLEQISAETGTPLEILIALNSSVNKSRTGQPSSTSSPTALAPVQSSLLSPNCTLQRRRSPRKTRHYVHPGHVCKCPRVKRRTTTSPAPQTVQDAASPPCVELALSAPKHKPSPTTYPTRDHKHPICSLRDALQSPHSISPSPPLLVTCPLQPSNHSVDDVDASTIDSPLFVNGDESLDVIYPKGLLLNRWEPYSTPVSPLTTHCRGQLSNTGSRRSPRRTQHYVQYGFLCKCPHMRKVG